MVVEKVNVNSENARVNEQVAVESGKLPVEQFKDGNAQFAEKISSVNHEGVASKEQKSSDLPHGTAVQSSPANAEQERQVENIMSEGLEKLFVSLTIEEQEKFRTEGEATAKKINVLLNESRVQIVKIFNLIKNWLSMLPGVNRYFLEQETKIKVDEIIQLKKGGEQ